MKKYTCPPTLVLECWDEPLSDAQLKMTEKATNELNEFQRKITEICSMVDSSHSKATPSASQQTMPTTTGQILLQPQINGSYVAVDAPNASPNQYKIFVQPINTGSQGGQISTNVVRVPFTTTSTMSHSAPRTTAQQPRATLQSPRPTLQSPRPTLQPPRPTLQPPRPTLQPPRPTLQPTRATVQPRPVSRPNQHAIRSYTPKAVMPTLVQAKQPRMPERPVVSVQPTVKQSGQTENLPPWKRAPRRRILNTDVVDLTAGDFMGDESSHIGGILPVSEVSRDEPEKTFPSLVVIARVHLSLKSISPAEETSGRTALDAKVKRILVLGPTALTEYLLQQQLIKSSQNCRMHGIQCKLGMYSDASRLPNSGGYVWVSECCPTSITSVFSGSIFESAPHPPSIILKLIYHWACQTSVQNVLHWVKVSNVYVKKMYTCLRSICVAIVHQYFPTLGGPRKVVEVGLISLGTGSSSGDNVCKHVKVEVLGIYDREKRIIRLKALEPIPDSEKFKRKKFLRCLQPLREYIHSESTIVTDICPDDGAWKEFGFRNVEFPRGEHYTNKNVMSYIRNVVPRMFQNTLSLLSRQLIQQFFDELVWRETWGCVPFKAYNKIMSDIVEVTKLENGTPLIKALCKVAMNPSKNWRFENWAAHCSSTQGTPVITPVTDASMFLEVTHDEPAENKISEDLGNSPSSADGVYSNVYLESYYYGFFDGGQLSKSSPMYTECVICLKDFKDNTLFADHLILHALNETYPKGEILKDVCRMCLKIPEVSMNAHVNQCHKDEMNKFCFCKICNVSLKTSVNLVKHMLMTHNELELPYTCDICYFRTSVFEVMQNHFSSAHKHLCCAQCPFCLKVVNFVNSAGEDILKNQYYFIRHIQRHQLPYAKKCPRCALSFTSVDILWDHLEKKHNGCATSPNIYRYKVQSGEGILMAPPQRKILTQYEKDVDKVYNDLKVSNEPIVESDHPVYSIKNLSFHNCLECDGALTTQHLVNDALPCTLCNFKSNCRYALCEHRLVNHSTTNKSFRWFEKGSTSPYIAPRAFHCSQCLFTTSNGNIMASHMMNSCRNAFCTTDKRKANLYFDSNTSPTESSKRKRNKSTSSRKRRKTNLVDIESLDEVSMSSSVTNTDVDVSD